MRLSLATRIFLGYAVVLVTFGAVSVFGITALHRAQAEVRLLSEGYLRISQNATLIETFHQSQERDMDRLRVEESTDTRRAMIRLARLYFPGVMNERLSAGQQALRDLRAFAPPSELPFITEVEGKYRELTQHYEEYTEVADAAYSLLERTPPAFEEAERRLDRMKQLSNSNGTTIAYLRTAVEQRIRERVEIAGERERRTGVTIIALSVLAIIVGVFATLWSARSLRPIRALIDGVARIRRGEFGARVALEGETEIAQLGREFDAMSVALRQRDEELRLKQAALVRAERLAAVGKVSAQIAHEVRNPLSSIGLNVELLTESIGKAKFPEPAQATEARELLSSVTREVDRVTEITENYLRLARLPTPAKRPEDITRIASEAVTFVAAEMQRARVDVSVVPGEPGLAAVPVDEGQLRQVLLNLLRNAREAMPDGGQITVALGTRDGMALVEVRDTGHGISPTVEASLFEPFASTKKHGTGLGLSLSRQIIESHGGTLTAANGPKGGAVFTVNLPFA